jgi:hypothetical protein
MLAAVGSAYTTGIQPAKQAEQHRVANAGFAHLRTRCRNLAKAPPADIEAARAALEAITDRLAQLEDSSTGVEARARVALEHRVKAWQKRRETEGAVNVPCPEDLPGNPS